MGFAYKCDVGYCPDSLYSSLSNLSELTFLDFDNIINFPGGKLIDSNAKTPSEFYSLVEGMIGDDVNKLYAIMRDNPDTGVSVSQATVVFPSLVLQFTKTSEFFSVRENMSNNTVAFYIKALSRVLITGGSTSTIFKVDGDGSLSRLGQITEGFFFGFTNGYGRYQIYNFYAFDSNVEFNEVNASNNVNWTTCQVEFYTSSFNTHYAREGSGIGLLFSDFSAPDYTPEPTPPEPDPPSGDIDVGTALPGGYDPDSDEIPWDVDNWLSAASLGLCTVYNPTPEQARALATRLYSKDFQSGFENYIWGNPIESIIGLSIMPCSIPNAGTATVKSWGLDTGVTMNLASNTLVHVDCGQLPVPKVYSGYLDYSPYTQVEIYIPYVGFIGLDADDIMGQTLQLHYYIDIISGSAAAKLVISNTSTTTVLGQWSCQVGRQIPVGSRDYNDIINSGIQLVAAAVGAYSGSVIPEVVTDLGDALQYEGGGFNGTRFFTQMLRAGSSAIMQAKPNITRGSSIASASGQLAVQYPYLILKRPVSAKTNGYGALVGYPTFKYGTIGEYKGFVRCHNIKLDNIGCTDWELSEIFKLCCEGVYI